MRLPIRLQTSQLHFAGWPIFLTTLWLLKGSLLVLYMRATVGLQGTYRIRIRYGIGLVVISGVIVLLTIFLSCRPLSNFFIPEIASASRLLPWSGQRCFNTMLTSAEHRCRLPGARFAANRMVQLRIRRSDRPVSDFNPITDALAGAVPSLEENWSGFSL